VAAAVVLLIVITAVTTTCAGGGGSDALATDSSFQGSVDQSPFDWEHPLPGGVQVGTLAEAAEVLPFTPLEPKLGTPTEILVMDPTGYATEDMALGLVYDDKSRGRYIVLEESAKVSQADLEGLADITPAPGTTPNPDLSTFRLVTIRDTVTGVFAARNVPRGDHPAVIEWLDGGINILIMGPEGTYTEDILVALANAF
jgi:hypothetical protein